MAERTHATARELTDPADTYVAHESLLQVVPDFTLRAVDTVSTAMLYAPGGRWPTDDTPTARSGTADVLIQR